MKEFNLKGTKRTEIGKKASRLARKNGNIPCVIYGGKKDAEGKTIATDFEVAFNDIRKLIYTPDIYLVNIDIDGEKCQAVMREIQFHPVKDNVLHVDFYQVTPGQPIRMNVPVKFEGHAKGVRAGGVLYTSVRYLPVKALAEQIPERLTIDVTDLEIGKSLKVGDLKFDNVELLSRPDSLICGVRTTRAVDASTTEEGAAEGEAPATEAAPAEESK